MGYHLQARPAMTTYLYSAIIGLCLAGALLAWEGRTEQAAPMAEQEVLPSTVSDPREQFALDVLSGVGNDRPTPEIVAFLMEWTIAEDGGDNALSRNNPLNTTLCGHNAIGAINSDGACGVGHYATYEDGVSATVDTLAQGNFSAITAALQGNDADGARAALWASPWAASHYGGGAGWPHVDVPAWGGQAHKCPYTDTMQVAEGSSFYSTGSQYWSGQYGGMHLGDDFVGNPGDPVYAPFDLTVEMVGRYDDPGRLGNYIQARFGDGTLFYAGHLIDVYVSGGQSVPACTVIGTLGATAGPHTHIKLGAPGAPVPCEGAQPGPGGCIDPLEYWETH